jgi:hypothetical protein
VRTAPLLPRTCCTVAAFALLLVACGERRDTADVAAGVGPFSELRGINIAQLRVGEVRAFRRRAVPAPFEGLREPIGEWDVLYDVPGFTGQETPWPVEDVQIRGIEATRVWPNDSSARAAFETSVREVRAVTGATPTCLEIAGLGFLLRVVEFDRGGGWTFAVKLAPETTLTNGTRLSARHSLLVRQSSFTSRYAEAGTPNPDADLTWTRVDCAAEGMPS